MVPPHIMLSRHADEQHSPVSLTLELSLQHAQHTDFLLAQTDTNLQQYVHKHSTEVCTSALLAALKSSKWGFNMARVCTANLRC